MPIWNKVISCTVFKPAERRQVSTGPVLPPVCAQYGMFATKQQKYKLVHPHRVYKWDFSLLGRESIITE